MWASRSYPGVGKKGTPRPGYGNGLEEPIPILSELWISEGAAGFPQSLLFPTLLQNKPVMRRHFL